MLKPQIKNASPCLLLLFGAGLFGTTAAGDGPVHIAVAANFKTVMEGVAGLFEKETDYVVTLTTGSTGKLYDQIVHGAPYHVFFAADTVRPRNLVEQGAALKGSQFTYATGRLALVAASASGKPPRERLVSGNFTRIAMANPDLAPYGAAARDLLRNGNLYEAVQDKLVYDENVAQAYQFVETVYAHIKSISLAP